LRFCLRERGEKGAGNAKEGGDQSPTYYGGREKKKKKRISFLNGVYDGRRRKRGGARGWGEKGESDRQDAVKTEASSRRRERKGSETFYYAEGNFLSAKARVIDQGKIERLIAGEKGTFLRMPLSLWARRGKGKRISVWTPQKKCPIF